MQRSRGEDNWNHVPVNDKSAFSEQNSESVTTSGVALYNDKKNESQWGQENLFVVKVNSFHLGFSCILAELAVNCNSKKTCKLDGNMEKE